MSLQRSENDESICLDSFDSHHVCLANILSRAEVSPLIARMRLPKAPGCIRLTPIR